MGNDHLKELVEYLQHLQHTCVHVHQQIQVLNDWQMIYQISNDQVLWQGDDTSLVFSYSYYEYTCRL